jgi:hypothetical protein
MSAPARDVDRRAVEVRHGLKGGASARDVDRGPVEVRHGLSGGAPALARPGGTFIIRQHLKLLTQRVLITTTEEKPIEEDDIFIIIDEISKIIIKKSAIGSPSSPPVEPATPVEPELVPPASFVC